MTQRRAAAGSEDAIKANPRNQQTMYDNTVIDSLPGGAFKQGMNGDIHPHYELRYTEGDSYLFSWIIATPV